jgi:hypothetical protein
VAAGELSVGLPDEVNEVVVVEEWVGLEGVCGCSGVVCLMPVLLWTRWCVSLRGALGSGVGLARLLAGGSSMSPHGRLVCMWVSPSLSSSSSCKPHIERAVESCQNRLPELNS